MKILGRILLSAGLLLSMAMLPRGKVHATATVRPLVLAYDQSFSTLAGAWAYRFNPFAGGLFVDGAIYENLYIVSIHDNAKQYPMLATYYRWSADLKTLTFTIRQGVKWSDGQPFTPDDVLFSIMLGKDCSVCDTANLWVHAPSQFEHAPTANLASVAKRGNTVSLAFKRVDTSIFAPLVNNLWIAPKHIWAHRKDPGTWSNPDPVGTGPFTQLQNSSSRSFDLAKNPYYWQRGEPRIRALRALLYTDANSENRDLEAGEIDWGTFFLENVANVFDRLNPNYHHYYSIRTTPVELYFNQTRYPYSLPAFRQAMSMAIDRSALANNAEYGYTISRPVVPGSSSSSPPGSTTAWMRNPGHSPPTTWPRPEPCCARMASGMTAPTICSIPGDTGCHSTSTP
jgi:peptide/nickel transport system substrate-binding protein